jgi:Cu-Zn family superoxide dismutase
MKTLALIAAAACSTAVMAQAPRTVALIDTHNAPVGKVALTDALNGVLVSVEASGLIPGWHAIHFHETANCSDAAFKTAGAHVHAATPTVHGLLNPAGNDLGDLPNIYAGADGKANAQIFSALVAMRPGTPRANLLDADGSAIVIHAKADDYTTQPIGGAGDRVACAALR